MKRNCKICIQTYRVAYAFLCLAMWFGIALASFSAAIIASSCAASAAFGRLLVFLPTTVSNYPVSNYTIINLWFPSRFSPRGLFPHGCCTVQTNQTSAYFNATRARQKYHSTCPVGSVCWGGHPVFWFVFRKVFLEDIHVCVCVCVRAHRPMYIYDMHVWICIDNKPTETCRSERTLKHEAAEASQ